MRIDHRFQILLRNFRKGWFFWLILDENQSLFDEKRVIFNFRRAQSVRAIVDCRDSAPDHLHFKKDDLIVVISRS